MFLNDTYFQGELSLPILKRSAGPLIGVERAVHASGEKNLEYFVTKYETKALRDILGPTLAMNFIRGINRTSNPIWKDLFNQIFQEDCDCGFSPVANYVYYFVKRDMRSHSTTVAEVASSPDNAARASEAQKLIKAWNDMCPQIHDIRRFICENWDEYGKYTPYKCRHTWYSHCMEFEPINVFNI